MNGFTKVKRAVAPAADMEPLIIHLAEQLWQQGMCQQDKSREIVETLLSGFTTPLEISRSHISEAEQPVAWCQPNYEGKIHPRKFMVVYEDNDMGNAVFDDEAEAPEHFENASISWNCYLFGLLPGDAHPPAKREAGEAAAPVHDLVDTALPPKKLTRSQKDLLERAERDGNALLKFGIRQRAGGAIFRSADRLRDAGLLDKYWAITEAGPAALHPAHVSNSQSDALPSPQQKEAGNT